MKRRVPKLRTDEEAEAFLESDLSDLDFSQFKSGRLRLDQAAGVAATRTVETGASAPSETYRMFEQAMVEKKQILCTYEGYRRELCPVILGHSKGEEKALIRRAGGYGDGGRTGILLCRDRGDAAECVARVGHDAAGGL